MQWPIFYMLTHINPIVCVCVCVCVFVCVCVCTQKLYFVTENTTEPTNNLDKDCLKQNQH